MNKKIKVFGVPASPYTQKMISILRYRHIAYEVFMGDVPGRLSRLEGIEPPKPEKQQAPVERSEDAPSHLPFWKVYTPLNIIKEIKYRLFG